MQYQGERKKDQMVDFAMKSSGPIVGFFDTYQQLSEVGLLSSLFKVSQILVFRLVFFISSFMYDERPSLFFLATFLRRNFFLVLLGSKVLFFSGFSCGI